MANRQPCDPGLSRRGFLQTVGAGVPTLTVMLEGASATRSSAGAEGIEGASGAKFTPIALERHFTASSADFGPSDRIRRFGGESEKDGLLRTPAGEQKLLGIPFRLGPDDTARKRWIAVSNRAAAWTVPRVEVPLGRSAGFLCLASFCDWDPNETPSANEDAIERVGQPLLAATLVYEDGSETKLLLRRRFEIHAPSYPWGHLAFAALSHRPDVPRSLDDALRHGGEWGNLQTVVTDGAYVRDGLGTLWISALANPEPAKKIARLRLEAASEDLAFVCGLTLFAGRESPLRYERLTLYRRTLPEPVGPDDERYAVEVDLGVVARTFVLGGFEPEKWLSAPDAGLGARDDRAPRPYLYAEVTSSREATLVLVDRPSGRRYAFDLAEAAPGKELESRTSGARVAVLEPDKVWVHGRVLDGKTGRPTPARLAFRSKDGRYIPPYGHRTDVNDAWFEDYGADVKLMDTPFAYVDGTFQVELPVGDVYVEITKGF